MNFGCISTNKYCKGKVKSSNQSVMVGPFKILENIGTNAFKLDLPPYMQIYPIANVENLRLFEPPLIYDQGEHVQLPSIDDFSLEYLDEDRKSTRLNSSHLTASRMPSSA